MAQQSQVPGLSGTVSLSPSPSLPSGAAQTVDRAFPGLAFEARSFWYYAGKAGKPINFSLNLLRTIANKTKTKPVIRVGGTSLDHSLGYDPDQPKAIHIPEGQPAGIPSNLTFGPSYFESFTNFPDARYILDLPFAYKNRTNSLRFIDAAYRKIGADRIYALELGNEVNLYRQPDIVASLGVGNDTKVWQAAATSAETVNLLLPGYQPDNPWQIPGIFENGTLVKDQQRIKSTSVHYYQTKINESSSLQRDIMSHAGIVAGSKLLKSVAEYLHKNVTPPIPLVLGEIGSSLGNGSSDADL
ncbi:uncharacterized protein A1O5_05241 [Cladophialophora psammophila CBS 110553]|uniref:Beta-glucuronidase C-terminal domain-containing protein n=1 Tax=Cladophialophora psammophila CBS 110553 TaxID=1182543 RepID=W9WU30_9EURO|nr:uncharacterized protein A1O5_05241 [Cladophialophora psammophila CBS 110553]EXJ71433.1 hypothetical protein A1O5_05241 [Cladophialophora psammophila CBS 110553]